MVPPGQVQSHYSTFKISLLAYCLQVEIFNFHGSQDTVIYSHLPF